MKFLTKVCCVFLISFLACFNVLARENAVQAFVMDVKPFGFYKNDNIEGLYVEFSRKIIEKAGYTADVKVVPFARAHDAVVAGNIDMTIMFDTAELRKDAIQSKAIISFENLAIPQKGKKLSKLTDLNGLKVGVIRQGCFDLRSRKELKIKLVEFNDYFQGIKLLKSGRIDVLCGSIIPMKASAKELTIDDSFFKNSFVVSNRLTHVHFSKKIPADKLILLQSAVNKLIRENYFEKRLIELKYK